MCLSTYFKNRHSCSFVVAANCVSTFPVCCRVMLFPCSRGRYTALKCYFGLSRGKREENADCSFAVCVLWYRTEMEKL